MKRIALLSPEPTINDVKGGRIAEKFVYLLCANTNCITRTVNEDVPPRFYNDAGTLRCRYCRRPYVISHRKVTEEEVAAAKPPGPPPTTATSYESLPTVIEPVGYPV